MPARQKEQLKEINARECWDLLAGEHVGRIGVVVSGRPEIFPVNYSLDASESVIIRTGLGTKLEAAVNHHVVFEVDRFDSDLLNGWSVVVHGVAHQTGRVMEGTRPLETWKDDTPYLLRIAATSITGRRIHHHPEGAVPAQDP
ncbi:MAG: pyridoxamine 5'-phosphate oxidase family protein [Acidimicrobiaceae bacterium]|nr:pyridoxamine 5'-phosphate oxidase family protein [Acidimicrobiaceae bacterium]